MLIGESLIVESPSYTNQDACAPINQESFKKDKTCYTREALIDIAKAWNASSYAKKENLIQLESSKKELWNALRNRITGCNNEWCWLNKGFVKSLTDPKQVKKHTFLAPIPKRKNEWLSTTDINFVMNQYIHIDHKFVFLGAVPIDFQDPELYGERFTPGKMQFLIDEGIRKFGIVFNLQPSTMNGSHWVALYIQLNTSGTLGKAYYYDSYGRPPPDEIPTWIKTFPVPLEFQYNDIQHQEENSECGVYTIHFLVNMIKGVSFNEIKKNGLSDDEMNALRKKYFNRFK